jgi:hypothetical protein
LRGTSRVFIRTWSCRPAIREEIESSGARRSPSPGTSVSHSQPRAPHPSGISGGHRQSRQA